MVGGGGEVVGKSAREEATHTGRSEGVRSTASVGGSVPWAEVMAFGYSCHVGHGKGRAQALLQKHNISCVQQLKDSAGTDLLIVVEPQLCLVEACSLCRPFLQQGWRGGRRSTRPHS